MNELTTYRWTFEEDVHRYVEMGYESIGVWRQKIADFGDERGVDLIAESGLRVSNLQWAGGFTGSDGRPYGDALADAADAIHLSGALRAGCLVIYTGGRNNHTFRHAERLFRNAIERLLELAEMADVVLAIEPMHPACAREWTFLTDVASALAVVEQFDSPYLKVVLDAYHFGDDDALLANLEQLVPHLAIVHLSDRRAAHSADQDRSPLGAGRLPLAKIVRGLIDAGYTGDFDIELFGREIETSDYESLLNSTYRVFEELLLPVSNA